MRAMYLELKRTFISATFMLCCSAILFLIFWSYLKHLDTLRQLTNTPGWANRFLFSAIIPSSDNFMPYVMPSIAAMLYAVQQVDEIRGGMAAQMKLRMTRTQYYIETVPDFV